MKSKQEAGLLQSIIQERTNGRRGKRRPWMQNLRAALQEESTL